MNAKVYFDMSTSDLNTKIAELKQELFNLRFKHATGNLENANQLNELKKDIARIKTVLRQRELGISGEPTATPKKKATKKA